MKTAKATGQKRGGKVLKKKALPKISGLSKRSVKTKAKAPKKPKAKKKTPAVSLKAKSKRSTSGLRKWALFIGAAPFAVALAVWKLSIPVPAPVPVLLPVEQPAASISAPVVEPDLMASRFSPASQLMMGERVAYWSDLLSKDDRLRVELTQLLGAPETIDSAPLIPKKFNCTTFIETLTALARSKTSRDFYSNLLAVRYKNGISSFINRNHFPEADWLPNNINAGIITDVTQKVATEAGAQYASVSKEIRRAEWLAQQKQRRKVSRAVASTPEWEQPVPVQVGYVPLEQFDRISTKIPNGAIVNIVRASSDAHPVLITHQGVVVYEGKTPLLRHASPGGKIRTIPLAAYVAALREGKKASKWPVVGMNFNQVLN